VDSRRAVHGLALGALGPEQLLVYQPLEELRDQPIAVMVEYTVGAVYNHEVFLFAFLS